MTNELEADLARIADPDPEVRRAAAEALGRRGSAEAVVAAALAGALSDPVADVRWWAAYALGDISDPSAAAPPLVRVLRDGDEEPRVRGRAAESLVWRLSEPDVTDALIEALDDPHADVRFWAAYALGESREERALEPLARLVGDGAVVPDWWSVGREARWAIAQIRAGWGESVDL